MSHRRLVCFLCLPLLLLAGCDTMDSVTDSVGDTLGLRSNRTSPAKVAWPPINRWLATHAGVAVSDWGSRFAARAGAAVLTDQGSAADAVTAMFFALSTTYPVAAGLGGGGICLVYDPAIRAPSPRIRFPCPHAANHGGAYAVPGAVRGFYQMQRQVSATPCPGSAMSRRVKDWPPPAFRFPRLSPCGWRRRRM